MTNSNRPQLTVNCRNPSLIFFLSGIFTLALGVWYYQQLRPMPQIFAGISNWLGIHIVSTQPTMQYVHLDWVYAAPTFLHTLAFSFLTLSFVALSRSNIKNTGIAWFAINFVFEVMQNLHINTTTSTGVEHRFNLFSNYGQIPAWLTPGGTFDWYDIVASAIGAGLFIVVALYISSSVKSDRQQGNCVANVRILKPVCLGATLIVGIACITGSYDYCNASNAQQSNNCPVHTDPGTNRNVVADPVYLSYSDLRSNAVYLEPDRPLASVGKIYLYNDYLFVNSPNEGIHIYNNQNPHSPEKVTFINVPGNIDIAIYKGYLYADSYIDLVTIDIRNINSPAMVDRKIDVFPYDPYQNIPDDIMLSDIDPNEGVIIGYTEQ